MILVITQICVNSDSLWKKINPLSETKTETSAGIEFRFGGVCEYEYCCFTNNFQIIRMFKLKWRTKFIIDKNTQEPMYEKCIFASHYKSWSVKLEPIMSFTFSSKIVTVP